jgi:hypothetical protein
MSTTKVQVGDASKTGKLTSEAALPLSTARSSLERSLLRFFSTAPTKHLLFRLTAFAKFQRGSHECRSAKRNADTARRARATSAPALRSAVCFLPAATIGKRSAFWRLRTESSGLLPEGSIWPDRLQEKFMVMTSSITCPLSGLRAIAALPTHLDSYCRVQGRRFLARGQKTEDHSRRCR